MGDKRDSIELIEEANSHDGILDIVRGYFASVLFNPGSTDMLDTRAMAS